MRIPVDKMEPRYALKVLREQRKQKERLGGPPELTWFQSGKCTGTLKKKGTEFDLDNYEYYLKIFLGEF